MANRSLPANNLVTDSEVLSLYQTVLPLLYSKDPQMATSQINKCLVKIIAYDFLHYFMDDPLDQGPNDRVHVEYTQWNGTFKPDERPVALKPQGIKEDAFAEGLKRNYNRAMELHLRVH